MALRNTCIAHVRRNNNIVNHTLAHYGRTSGRIAVWLGSGPDGIVTPGYVSNTSLFPQKKHRHAHPCLRKIPSPSPSPIIFVQLAHYLRC